MTNFWFKKCQIWGFFQELQKRWQNFRKGARCHQIKKGGIYATLD